MEKNSARAWASCIVVTLVCATAMVFNAKYSPAVTQLMEAFNITLTTSSVIVSVLNIGGCVLAVPGGTLATKFGVKKMLILGLAFMIVGGLTSVVSFSFPVFIIGRLLEGFGYAFMMVLGPTVMSQYFTPDKVGLPMGIQGTWTSIGVLIALNVGSLLLPSTGWRGLWWFSIIFAVVMLIATILVLPKDQQGGLKAGESSELADEGKLPKGSYARVFKNPAIWLLGLVMFGYTFASAGIQNFGPTYLAQACDFPATESNLINSLNPIGKIIGSLLVGVIMLKFKSKPKLMTIILCFVFVGSLLIWSFTSDTSVFLVVAFFFVCGAIFLFVPPTVNATVPEVVFDPRVAGVGMGVVIMIQNFGQIISPLLISGAVEGSGGNWMMAGVVIAIAVAVSIACAVILIFMTKKKSTKDVATTEAA